MSTDVVRRRYVRLGASLMVLWAVHARAADHSSWIRTTSAAGEKQLEVQDGQVVYEVNGPGIHRTSIVDLEDRQNVIVQLRGAPLGVQQRTAGRGGRRTAAALQATVAAAAALDAQHAQVRQALADIVARGGGTARALGGEPYKIRFEYRSAFNGLALRAPSWIVDALRRNPNVLRIRPDARMRANLAESVPLIGASELHAQGLTGEGITVGIIDTGIDYTHPDLGGGIGLGFKVVGGYDFVNGDDDPQDDNGHGTHVAGIVAANGTVKGVAPGARLVAYKVLSANGSGSASNIIAALDRATDPDGDPTTDDRLDVANLSLGASGGDPDDPPSLAVDGAVAAGVVVVVAAGNDGPGSQTIGSPGLARRALTVGATDKSDRLAFFSSRGPSERIYGVKPEVVAPGDSIVSTLPSNSTGAASGTSMATPHVAGGAALLLQARPSLTPDAVKSVLMTSARDLGVGLFVQGAGRIDLPAANRRTTIVTPAAVSFGLDDVVQPRFEASQVLTVTNLGSTTRRYTASALTPGLPGGIVVSLSPKVLELGAGETGGITVSLSVDNTTVANVPSDPPVYEGRVRLQSGEESIQVPFGFLKGAQLHFTFDPVPDLVLVRNTRTGDISARSPIDTALTMLLPAGSYEAYVSFGLISPTEPSRFRYALVVRPGIALENVVSLDVRSADAVHVVTAAPVGELGSPVVLDMRRSTLRVAGVPFSFSNIVFGSSDVELAYSSLTPAYLVDWVMAANPTAKRTYTFTWHRAGLTSSETLRNAAADLTPLQFQLDADPGLSSAEVIHMSTGVSSSNFDSVGRIVRLTPPFTWTRVVMPKPPGDSLFGYIDQEVSVPLPGAPPGPPAARAYKTPLFQAAAGTTRVSFLETTERGFITRVAYRTPRTLFDIGLEPLSWFGRFLNEPESIGIAPARGFFGALFVGQTMDGRFVPQLPYELSQGGTVVHSGALPGNGFAPPISVTTAGKYTLKISGPAGNLDGHPTATTVKASFDTRASDKNPPVLSHFRVLAEGVPSKAFCIGKRAEIRFHVTDDVRVRDVGLQFRLGGQGFWLPWPLERDGDDFVARLPLGSGHLSGLCDGRETQSVPISLRIHATDAQGNSLETEMTPAYARRLPRFSPVPFSVDGP